MRLTDTTEQLRSGSFWVCTWSLSLYLRSSAIRLSLFRFPGTALFGGRLGPKHFRRHLHPHLLQLLLVGQVLLKRIELIGGKNRSSAFRVLLVELIQLLKILAHFVLRKHGREIAVELGLIGVIRREREILSLLRHRL